MYVGETRGVHEVAGNPTDPPTPKLMLRRRRMVLVLAHRPPYDPRQPWIGTAASLEMGCKPCRGCTLDGNLVVVANGAGLIGGGESSSLIHGRSMLTMLLFGSRTPQNICVRVGMGRVPRE